MKPTKHLWNILAFTTWGVALAGFVPLSSLAADLSSQMVKITTETNSGKFNSSGILVEQNIVATGCVGAYPANSIHVTRENGRKGDGVVLYHDDVRNICLIRANSGEAKIAAVLGASPQRIGSAVVVLGFSENDEFRSTKGKVVSLADAGAYSAARIDAPLFDGAGGAGVFDLNGRLVGLVDVVGAKFGTPVTITPVSWIRKALADLSEGKTSGNDGEALANIAIGEAVQATRGAGCELTVREQTGFLEWRERHTTLLQTITSAPGFPNRLTYEQIYCEARRASVDPDMLLAFLRNLGPALPAFTSAPAGDSNSGAVGLSGDPVGVMAISGLRVDQVMKSSLADVPRVRALLETPTGNLRAGLFVLRAYLNATNNNPALAARSYVLNMAFVPETFALLFAQRTIISLEEERLAKVEMAVHCRPDI